MNEYDPALKEIIKKRYYSDPNVWTFLVMICSEYKKIDHIISFFPDNEKGQKFLADVSKSKKS